MRARALVTRAWEQLHNIPGFYGGQGMGAQRAAWQISFRAEQAAKMGHFYGQALLDLVKAFERLPHKHIVAAAVRHGYDLFVLRLSLAAYRLRRAVGIDGAYSRCIIAVLGVTAGSGFATTELRLLMIDVVVSKRDAWPLVSISMYVDDGTIESSHRLCSCMQRMLTGATSVLIDICEQQLQLEISAKKSAVVGCSLKVARSAVQAISNKALCVARHAKLLGTDDGGGAPTSGAGHEGPSESTAR
jgi:hypothetical protein